MNKTTVTLVRAMEHVDLSYIIRLAGGNKQFVDEIINSFIEITPSYIREVKFQYEEKNWTGLRMSAHRLKSAVKYLGLYELARIAETIEERALEPADHQNLLELMAAMNTTYAAAVNELKNQLDKFTLQLK